jgi:DNA-directed RNA polymerase specialized sigma24 family protein
MRKKHGTVSTDLFKSDHRVKKYKVEYFKSWLYMVAKNHCLMKIRDRSWENPRGVNGAKYARGRKSCQINKALCRMTRRSN